jgi:hypothetical protein
VSSQIFGRLKKEIRDRLKKQVGVPALRLTSATGEELTPVGVVEVEVSLGQKSVGALSFIVVKNSSVDVCIGMDSLIDLRFGKIDPREKTIEYWGLGAKRSAKPFIIQLMGQGQGSKGDNSSSKGKHQTDVLVGSLYLTKDVLLPKNSETLTVDTRVKGMGAYRDSHPSSTQEVPVFMVDTDARSQFQGGVKLIPTIVSADKLVIEESKAIPARLLNTTQNEIVLKRGTRVGRVEALDAAQIQLMKHSNATSEPPRQ